MTYAMAWLNCPEWTRWPQFHNQLLRAIQHAPAAHKSSSVMSPFQDTCALLHLWMCAWRCVQWWLNYRWLLAASRLPTALPKSNPARWPWSKPISLPSKNPAIMGNPKTMTDPTKMPASDNVEMKSITLNPRFPFSKRFELSYPYQNGNDRQGAYMPQFFYRVPSGAMCLVWFPRCMPSLLCLGIQVLECSYCLPWSSVISQDDNFTRANIKRSFMTLSDRF